MSNTATTPSASPQNFELLQLDPRFDDLVEVLAKFLGYAFDDPAAAEVERWTLSCLPTTNKSSTCRRLFTLNIGPMQVLYVEQEFKDGVLVNYWMSVFVSSSALESETRCSIEELDGRYESVCVRRTSFSSADGDSAVITCSLDDVDEFASFPLDPRTIRPLIDRFVAKGKGPYEQYHNRRFANFVLEGMVNHV